jgi:hypothetical protein
MPMLLAGAAAAGIFLLLRGVGPALTAGYTRDELGAAVTLWGVATLGVSCVTLALWRFWPAPAARLF